MLLLLLYTLHIRVYVHRIIRVLQIVKESGETIVTTDSMSTMDLYKLSGTPLSFSHFYITIFIFLLCNFVWTQTLFIHLFTLVGKLFMLPTTWSLWTVDIASLLKII